MAIDSLYLALLAKAIQTQRGRTDGARRLSALALGYPDLLVPKANLEGLFGPKMVASLKQRDDAAMIKQWHGLPSWTDPVYDSLSLFDSLGIDVMVTDVAVLRGMEVILDLNEALPDDLKASFDLVIDTGTCEHCFNVGTAFRNICEAVAVGGHLIHAAPMTRMNHGFWNFCPTVYPDYLGDNGFQIMHLSSVTGGVMEGQKTLDVEPFARFEPKPHAALYVVAERPERRVPVWPVQRKYRGLIKS
jgi:hypothetical protein